MNITKDLRNVIFSFGAIFLVLSIGTYVYYAQPMLPEELSAISITDPDSMDDWTFTQPEIDNSIVTIASSTEPLEPVSTTTEPVVPIPAETNTQFSDAIAKKIADQKTAQEKAVADARAVQIATEKLVAEKAAADLLAMQLEAERLAKEKAAAEKAVAAKKSRKSRAS